MIKGTTHRKLCKRWDAPWTAHFLTFSCFGRQPFLSGKRSPQWMIDAVEAARTRHPFDLWGYVIMLEHVHLLILPHEGAPISRILYGIKKPVTTWALAFARKHAPHFLPRMLDVQPNGRQAHRFWQRGGGYDRNMRSPPEIYEKLRYIHGNPVSRGLVGEAEAWAWSSARAWATGVDEPLAIDRASFPEPELR